MENIFALLDYGPSLVVCNCRFGEVSVQSSRHKQSKNCSTLEDGSVVLSRNVGNTLPTAAHNPEERRPQHQMRGKREISQLCKTYSGTVGLARLNIFNSNLRDFH
jgi:hypothetical protein